MAVTLVAVLGGIGVLPTEPEAAAANLPRTVERQPDVKSDPTDPRPSLSDTSPGSPAPDKTTSDETTAGPVVSPTVPADSGQGRRIVFAMHDQRVWLVDADGEVQRTYLVSGSVTDNLHPGSYEVYSKSMDAIGVDDSGTMKYMVRFTHGANAAIGFHDIPVLDGAKVQTRDELGTPQSHGCIRQWPPDAKALWEFAPVGTSVVVVA